jgi:hypothetical protein
MKALFSTAFFCFALLFSAFAQNEGEKTRLKIWHETARFVYADNGKPELADKLQSESKPAFEASIKADEEKVYSRLYKPLEESGSIYAGLRDEQAKTNKLIVEIVRKLRESPSRKGKPERQKAVDDLQSRLAKLANGMTLPEAETVQKQPTAVDSAINEPSPEEPLTSPEPDEPAPGVIAAPGAAEEKPAPAAPSDGMMMTALGISLLSLLGLIYVLTRLGKKPASDPKLQQEIADLRQEVAILRAELERKRGEY